MTGTFFTPIGRHPLAESVCEYLGAGFQLAPSKAKGSLARTVTEEIASKGQCRAGGPSTTDCLHALEKVVEMHIARNEPIPILCPWGSRKPSHLGIDVADLGGLRMIECLNRRVMTHYKPGIAVRIRIENVGGHYLFADTGEAGRKASKTYVDGVLDLIDVLGFDCLTAVPESTLMTEETHSALAREIEHVIRTYIVETDQLPAEKWASVKSWQTLVDLGWLGEIPVVQREYYRGLYRNLYPGRGEEVYTTKLAGYLASSLARYKLKGTGALEVWGGNFVQLNFCCPIPGMPQSMTAKTVYYRTVPEKVAKTHIPPWRAQGYIKFEGGAPCLKIARHTDQLPFEPCTIKATRAGRQVEILAPLLQAA